MSPETEDQPDQLLIDEYVLDAEHLRGAVPADATEAKAAKDAFYNQLVSKAEKLGPILCMPTYGVHVFHVGRRLCVCKDQKRSSDAVRSQIEELP